MGEKTGAAGKALLLLREVVALKGEPFNPERYSKRLGVPVPNLYRYLNTLLENGVLIRPRRGEYLLHPSFLTALQGYSANAVLEQIARPELETLVRRLPATFHFGVMESDMVTYLVKVAAPGEALFTQENVQLEAYCSGIGKVLLAALPAEALDDYLSADAFPGLTARTLTTPAAIRAEVEITRERGYGVDDREVDDNLVCLAVPVVSPKGATLGAVSAASTTLDLMGEAKEKTLTQLRAGAARIGAVL